MHRILPICFLSLLLAGCATRYDITQFNGTVIRAKSKPRLDKENAVYTFKDMSGNEAHLSAGRVRLIEPVRRGSKQKSFDAFQDFQKR